MSYSNKKSSDDEIDRMLRELDNEYNKTLERGAKEYDRKNAGLDDELRLMRDKTTEDMRNEIKREASIAKQCLNRGDIAGYEFRRKLIDQWYNKLKERRS